MNNLAIFFPISIVQSLFMCENRMCLTDFPFSSFPGESLFCEEKRPDGGLRDLSKVGLVCLLRGIEAKKERWGEKKKYFRAFQGRVAKKRLSKSNSSAQKSIFLPQQFTKNGAIFNFACGENGHACNEIKRWMKRHLMSSCGQVNYWRCKSAVGSQKGLF